MDTIPNEMVRDPMDRAAIHHLMQSIAYGRYFERKVRSIPHYAFSRSSAPSRLCLRLRASAHASGTRRKRSAALVSRKSSGCALARSSQVRGIDTGAPGTPRGEYATLSVLPRTFML